MLNLKLDDEVIKEIAANSAGVENKPILKYWCETQQVIKNLTFTNGNFC